MRNHILAEIRRLATAHGQAPGQKLFGRETGITEHEWRGKFWARWGDALIEAGYGPNEWTQSLEPDQILSKLIDACRHYRKLPTQAELHLYRKIHLNFPHLNTIKRHFGNQSAIVAALAKHVAGNEGYQDILAILPSLPTPAKEKLTLQSKNSEGLVYLIRSGDFYKIGRSDDLERRIKEIRIALPDKAILIHTISTDDPPGIEAYWHNRFGAKRANGEWFRLSSLDVSAFKKRKYQ